ncbi:hypothetical protein [Actinomadura madurae]|uniref:hypothetical protein n=1 Tax=Actinomadura madurae TaxID=1993 RepID=UPI0020D1FAA7|nr:hypothetical protein [Actinomadura madurae]MCQ0009216.1 hypothetical protein [Actinomadura madurae]
MQGGDDLVPVARELRRDAQQQIGVPPSSESPFQVELTKTSRRPGRTPSARRYTLR